jgi:hypothetical protein
MFGISLKHMIFNFVFFQISSFLKFVLLYCNGFDQRVARQQLCKHGPTRNKTWCCFLCRPRQEAEEQRGYATRFKATAR